MRLTGALSNPQQGSRVAAASRAFASSRKGRGLAELPARPALRLPAGVIKQAVLDVLAATDRCLRPCEVRAKVELRLGQRISYDTVAWCLGDAVRRGSSSVLRSSKGRYRLRRSS